MLIIPDIHINSKYSDQIVSSIQDYISNNDAEKNIIFLGDYVYHFSYDREAILKLCNLFVELFLAGKNVYILAWNHDWLGSSFVFEESKKAFDIIKKIDTSKHWTINFITEPTLETIDWKQILLFPFQLDYTSKVENTVFSSEDPILKNIQTQIQELWKSKHKRELESSNLNQKLLNIIQTTNKEEELIIIHHHYFEWVSFPWLQSAFSFKNIALSKYFLDLPNIKFISWHIHYSFVYKNYICLWSVRNSSPLEINDIKTFAQYKDNSIELTPHFINPYFVFDLKSDFFDGENILTQQTFQRYLDQIFIDKKDILKHSIWDISVKDLPVFKYNLANVVIKVDDMDYKKIDNYIEPEFWQTINNIKLQKNITKNTKILDSMKTYQKWEMQKFADWKAIVSEYIKKKYPDNYDKYMDMLSQLKLT